MIEAAALLWIALALGVGAAAHSRGRSFLAWTLIAIVISPLIALVFLIAFRNRHGEPRSRAGAVVLGGLVVFAAYLCVRYWPS